MYGIELENVGDAKKNKIYYLDPRILRSFGRNKMKT